MGQPRVFISYSHADKRHLDELRKILQTHGFECWDDGCIDPGTLWRDEISAALDEAQAGVLLVTHNFLGSRFIQRVELPRLLKKHRARGTLFWIHCSPAAFERTALEELQAAHDPSKPLSRLNRHQRLETLNRIAARVAKACERAAKRREALDEPPGAATRAGPMTRIGPDEAATLTIQLEPLASAVKLTYHRPQYGIVSEAHYDEPGGLETLRRALEAGGAFAGQNLAPAELRDRLLHLLLPGSSWSTLSSGLFGSPQAHVRYPVRVRLLCQDPALTSLPWLVTSSDGGRLVNAGWTFEVVSELDPTRDVTLPAPCRVLVTSGEGADSPHVSDIRSLLASLSSVRADRGYFRVVQSMAELRPALEEFRPHVLYCFGPARATAPVGLHFVLGGAPLDLEGLRALLQSTHQPDLVVLNPLLAPGERALVPRAPLGARVPAVVINLCGAESGDAELAARRWLRALLVEGSDPVTALCVEQKVTASFAAFTSYRRWTTVREPERRVVPRRLLELDRYRQRAEVAHHVQELVRSRRVVAMLACADRGNKVDKLSEQALTYLDDMGVALVKRIQLVFPESRDPLREQLRSELLLRLEPRPSDSLAQALQRAAPAHRARMPLLWLDWGVVGERRTRRLDADDLGIWLDFAFDLVRECHDDFRIVSYLAVETDASKHAALARLIDGKGRALIEKDWNFRYARLEPLGSIPYEELLNFLADPTTSTCPDAARAARLIFEETGGKYDETYERIALAERDGWAALLTAPHHEPGPSESQEMSF